MLVTNYLTISDEEFLADSNRCWQEALANGDMIAFEFWAVHALSFARRMFRFCKSHNFDLRCDEDRTFC